MQLFSDYGYITQEQFQNVDGKCKDQGPELPDDCQKALEDVNHLLFRSTIWLTAITSTTLTGLAIKTQKHSAREN